MEETKFDEATLEFFKTIAPPISEHFIWDKHWSCFPKTKEGLYGVYADITATPHYVKTNQIGDYPWIGINSYWGSDFDDKVDDEYSGVNDAGIALIVFDMSHPVKKGKKIRVAPTIICEYGETTHYMYRLKRFIPKNPSLRTKKYFVHVMDLFDDAVNGQYVFDRPVLNPFSPEVRVLEVNTNNFELKDLQKIDQPTEEEKRKRRELGKKRQAEAARETAAKRNDKSIRQLCEKIEEMKLLGQDFKNKTKVAEFSGISRRTVQRNWMRDAIQKLL